MSFQYDLPVVLTAAGVVPTDPDTIRSQIVANVTATDPDFTANLPASMVEDLVSTAVAAASVSDQARVELLNSLTPAGANEFLLTQLGQVYGVVMGQPTNASALLTFSGTVGYTISQGFLVTDGSYVYQTQATVTIGSTGSTQPVNAIALDPNATVAAANAINQLITSVPSQYTVAVTNPAAGVPAATPETFQSYRGRVMAAGTCASVSTGRFIRTLLAQVPGVNPQQIGVQQNRGGAAPLAAPTANTPTTATTGGTLPAATYYYVVTTLNALGETTASNEVSVTTTGTTSANTITWSAVTGATGYRVYRGTATGTENVYYAVGAVTTLTDTGAAASTGSPPTNNTTANTAGFRVIVGGSGDPYAIANAILQSVADPTDLTGSSVSSSRTVTVSVSDYPDTYTIPYVVAPSQSVTMVITWNTSLLNFAGGGTFQALVAPIISAYVSNLPVGAPINELEMAYLFQQAVAAQIDQNLITRLVFSVYINGTLVSPASGYADVVGDPEGFFVCASTAVTVNQG